VRRSPPAPAQPIAGVLLAWYDAVRRDLPFRNTRDPYAIWVSEVMLQQTQVATVVPYFTRWMARFPTVRALAAADEDAVLHAFSGLGYYSRARSLHRAARAVVERFDGALPDSVAALCTLPGIGPYSAGAIASIAFGARVPVVDGNVIRVLCRLLALAGDPGRAPLKSELWARAAELVPAARPGDFNQALMELGATICTPRAPRCADCPLAAACQARAEGRAETLPELPPRPEPTLVRMAAALVVRSGRVAVVKLRADAPRWAGMWQFPNVELGAPESEADGACRAAREIAGIVARVDAPAAVVKHSVTRYRITLTAFRCSALSVSPGPLRLAEALAWRRPAELERLAMPAAHRRLAPLAGA